MKTHDLKTDPEVYDALRDGRKRFEIRKDDRGFSEGDLLHLLKTVHSGAEMAAGAPLKFTGDSTWRRVGYIMRGPVYGLEAGWVIMCFA